MAAKRYARPAQCKPWLADVQARLSEQAVPKEFGYIHLHVFLMPDANRAAPANSTRTERYYQNIVIGEVLYLQ